MEDIKTKVYMPEETTKVRVAVRVRPQTGNERAAGCTDCVDCNLNTRQVLYWAVFVVFSRKHL
jgi:hypothetical protein